MKLSFKWLNVVSKNIWVMGIASFFNDMSSEMIYPILPLFLTTTLGASVEIVGLIEGVAVFTSYTLRILSGYISDKVGRRKPIVAIGYTLSSVAKILFGYAHQWPTVFLGRFFDRFGKGVRAGAKAALVTESSEHAQRGIAFGIDQALDTAGAVLGPLIAVFLLYFLRFDFRSIFFIAVIPAVIGLIIFLIFVSDQARIVEPIEKINLSIRVMDQPYLRFLLVSALFALGNSAEVFMILRARSLGMSVIQTILVYALGNVSYAIFAIPAGIIADRFHLKRVLMGGFLLFSLVYFLFGINTMPVFVWFLYIGYGAYMAFTNSVAKTYVSFLVTTYKAGTAFGFYDAVQGICQMLASIIAGILWKRIGVSAPFLFGSIMALLATIVFWLLERNHE